MLFVANWKANFSYQEAVDFVLTHYNDFSSLTQNHTLILCPSYDALPVVAKIFAEHKVKLGAQDCSLFSRGNYTGQVLAQSLKEIGCTYCIIGHSEQRRYNHETDENVAKKFYLLLDKNICPIVCIGESKEEYAQDMTLKVLEKQLMNLFNPPFSTHTLPKSTLFCIAYEPIWSIGTGLVASQEHLQTVFTWLSDHLQKFCPQEQFRLLYGGSVSLATMPLLCTIAQVSGFLIGGASTNFEEFKKIVTYRS